MKANWERLARRLLLTGGLCVWLGAMTAWSQEAPPPAPGTAEQGAAGDAKEGDKGAKEKAADSAADNTKSPAPGASGTAPGTSGTSPGRAETTPGTAGTAPGRAGTTPAAEGAKGAAKSDPFDGPTDTTREGARTAARDALFRLREALDADRSTARVARTESRPGSDWAVRQLRLITRPS